MAVHIGVLGSGVSDPGRDAVAETIGSAIGRAGALLVCGGLGGVMAAACRGAVRSGGVTLGLLPGDDRSEANEWVSIAVPTGLGEARNVLVVRAADVVVAIGGEYGTLSEVAFALKSGRPVVGVETWALRRPDGTEETGIVRSTVHEAVEIALALATQDPHA